MGCHLAYGVFTHDHTPKPPDHMVSCVGLGLHSGRTCSEPRQKTEEETEAGMDQHRVSKDNDETKTRTEMTEPLVRGESERHGTASGM